jgi:type IV secretory pathway VirB6-like protein
MPRLVPQTAFTALANNVANIAAAENAKLPPPANTLKKNCKFICTSYLNLTCPCFKITFLFTIYVYFYVIHIIAFNCFGLVQSHILN